MRMSMLLNQTLRETPARGEAAGVNFLVRAGYLHPVSSGSFVHLPLGVNSIQKMQRALRQSLDQPSAQEVFLPPGIQAMDAAAGIILRNVQSYRHLPRQFFCFGFQRPPVCKIPSRIMSQSGRNNFSLFSLSASPDEMGHHSREQFNLLEGILQKWLLPVLVVPNGSPRSPAAQVTEMVYPSELGEQTILYCPSCGYSANRQTARFYRGDPSSEDLLPLEEVHTPGAHTIQALADYLQVDPSRTAKAVLLMAPSSRSGESQSKPAEELIFVIVRGDLDIDEDKLACLLEADTLRPATEAEIRAAGAEPGYASPVGLKNIRVVVDESIPRSANLVAGANRPHYHLRNVNYGRDYTAWEIADIAAACEGAPCPQCHASLSSRTGVLVGCTERWKQIRSGSQAMSYLDSFGKPQSVCMASCWLDLETVLACSAQEHHDEKGLLMPESLAPYSVHMVVINSKDGTSEQAAEKIYRELTEAGLEVLLDDRAERAGVKFNDADLIGLPLRITVSERNLLENRVEIKLRNASEPDPVPMDQILNHVVAVLSH